jgi:lipoyl(octanoyl) transferase
MEIWQDTALVPYPNALERMEKRIEDIAKGIAGNTVWLLEHPPLYTAGTSARESDLVGGFPFPVYDAGRGGQYTYHGPGQRVAYTMFDLRARGRDVRRFVSDLEQVIIMTLAQFNITGERRGGRVGVWVVTPEGEKKIAALGIRLRKWISFHGISINVHPDLQHFGGIVPCGLPSFGVTSFHDLGVDISLHELDNVLIEAFEAVFPQESSTFASSTAL